MKQNLETIALVSKAFCATLREWLTPAEFAEMQGKLSAPDYQSGACPSHDYCDANMAMDEAIQKVTGKQASDELPEMSDATLALWGDAWQMARDAKFNL